MMAFIEVMVLVFNNDKDLHKEVVKKVTDTVTDMTTYEMTEKEIKGLPTTK